MASYSSRGVPTRHADVLAPGTSITSLADPGSLIDSLFAGGRVASDFFKGTGTSQAAGVVSGAAALMLSRYPNLNPDDVKSELMHGGSVVAGAGHAKDGDYSKVFELDLGKDTLSKTAAQKHVTPKFATAANLINTNDDGFHLDAARGDMNLSYTTSDVDPDTQAVTTTPHYLTGDFDVTGTAWDGAGWRDAWKAYWVAYKQNPKTAVAPEWSGESTPPPGATLYGGGTWDGRYWKSLGWAAGASLDPGWQGRYWKDGGWH